MKTREQFVDAWKHEISGVILEAAMSGRHGAELSVWLRTRLEWIDWKLVAMYDSVDPSHYVPPPPIQEASLKEIAKWFQENAKPPSLEAQAETFIANWKAADVALQKSIKDKLRLAMNGPVEVAKGASKQ